MSDKRTKQQQAFDLAKHGWTFCNADMLAGKIAQCQELLPRGDMARAAILGKMKKALKTKTSP